MKRFVPAALFVLIGPTVALANTTFPYPPAKAPAPAPVAPGPDPKPVIVGVATTSAVVLAGLWLSRRRTKSQG